MHRETRRMPWGESARPVGRRRRKQLNVFSSVVPASSGDARSLAGAVGPSGLRPLEAACVACMHAC